MSEKQSIAQQRKKLQAELDKLDELEKLESQKAVTEKSIAVVSEVFASFAIGKISKGQAKKLGQFLQQNGIEELLKKL